MTTTSESDLPTPGGAKSARGRKPRQPIEQLKSRAWGLHVFHVANAKTQYQFDQIWLSAGCRIPRALQISPAPEIHRSMLGEKSPSTQTLKFVERYFPGTEQVYTLGIGKYPLWEILEGPIEVCRQTLIEHTSDLHGYGVIPPVSAYLSRTIKHYFNEFQHQRSVAGSSIEGIVLNSIDFSQKSMMTFGNIVAKSIQSQLDTPVATPDPNNKLAGFCIDDIAVIIASYRLALFTGDQEHELLYYLNGISKVVKGLLEPWGIRPEQIYDRLQRMWDDSHKLAPNHPCARSHAAQ